MLAYLLQDEIDEFPKTRTINRWKNEEQWELRATEDISQVAQQLNKRHFERLFALTEEAEETYAAILAGDHPETDPRKLEVIFKVAQDLLKLRGLGTAGGYAPPAIPSMAVRIDGSGKTPTEISRELREYILEENANSARNLKR